MPAEDKIIGPLQINLYYRFSTVLTLIILLLPI